MKTFAILLAAVLFSSAIPASGQTGSTAPAKPKSSTTQKPTTPKTGASPSTKTYDRALLRPALLRDKAPETFQVKFETTRGDFTVTVTRAWSPLAADRFYTLVKHHYFDNARVFRVVPNFVVQFGI